MSKKYDEYKSTAINGTYLPFEVTPMIPNTDPDLDREIRDRAIISLVEYAHSVGKELTYGDIRMIIDEDPSEKEYEKEREELNQQKVY